MELAVSTVVALILGVIIFGFGIYILGRIDTGIRQVETTINSMDEKQLLEQISHGGLVAVPESKKRVERGDIANYWIAIRNQLGTDGDFTVVTEFTQAYDVHETALFSDPALVAGDIEQWIAGTGVDSLQIANNEMQYLNIYIKPGSIGGNNAPRGTYFFNLCVMPYKTAVKISCASNTEQSYPQHKIYRLLLEVR